MASLPRLQVNKLTPISHDDVSTMYFFSPKHRGNPTNEISVWTIDLAAELDCFLTCFQNKWHNGNNGWGFVADGTLRLSRLGYNLRTPELLLAKFVIGDNQWHGYPADVRHKPADKPIPSILTLWLNMGYISKSLMTRIKQGQI